MQKNKEWRKKKRRKGNVIFPFCPSIEVHAHIQIYGNFSHDRLCLQNKSISLRLRSSSYRKRRRRKGFILPFLTAEIYITTLLFPILTWLPPPHPPPSPPCFLLFLSDIRRYNLHFLFRVFFYLFIISLVSFSRLFRCVDETSSPTFHTDT